MWTFSSSIEYIQKNAQVISDNVRNLPKLGASRPHQEAAFPFPRSSPLPSASDDFPTGNRGWCVCIYSFTWIKLNDVFLCLVLSLNVDVFEIHLCCCMWMQVIHPYCWARGHHLDVAQFIHFHSYRWACGYFLGRDCWWIRLLWTFLCTSFGKHLSTLLLSNRPIARSCGEGMSHLIRNHQLSKVSAPFCVPTRHVWVSSGYSTSSSTLGIFCIFHFSHPKWYPAVVLNCISWQSTMSSPSVCLRSSCFSFVKCLLDSVFRVWLIDCSLFFSLKFL